MSKFTEVKGMHTVVYKYTSKNKTDISKYYFIFIRVHVCVSVCEYIYTDTCMSLKARKRLLDFQEMGTKLESSARATSVLTWVISSTSQMCLNVHFDIIHFGL